MFLGRSILYLPKRDYEAVGQNPPSPPPKKKDLGKEQALPNLQLAMES